MEFLLASQKKNRTWIMLKQLLLLLLRMAVIATLVFMLAGPRLRSWIGQLFGTTNSHHIVLLDDSFSTSDRWADTSAFHEGMTVVKWIGDEAARQIRPQTFTLLRFSRVAHPQRGTQPDMLEVRVDRTEFVSKLDEVLGEMRVSQTSAGPAAAMDAIDQLLGNPGDERRIVHLISDFRAREWKDPTDLKKQLMGLSEKKAEIHLINCVDRTRKNLAVTSLAPAEGIQAAGVQFFMEVSVQNFGQTPAREVSVFLEEEVSGSPGDESGRRPAVTIAEIPPGQTVTERFRVHLPAAGKHLLAARLKPDAVEVDNSRYHCVDLPPDVPVLLIDGSLEARGAQYVGFALAPGGPVRTGIRPQIETPRYLSLKPLGEFRAITLMDVERLDKSAIEALEKYIRRGGGVAVFLGRRCSGNGRFINENFYRGGEGFLPVPLLEAESRTLSVIGVDRAPDMQVTAHPIFRILAGKRNSFISMVIIERYLPVPDDWRPQTDSTTRVIARLRDGAPLAVERRFGEGRVVALLTTADPVWNNWARNPSFPAAMVDMHAYLSQRSATEPSRRVGSKLELELDEGEYEKQVRFVTPGHDPGANREAEAGSSSSAGGIRQATPTKQGTLAVSFAETDASGIYQARLTRKDGTKEVRSYALNVDAEEGDLKASSGTQLAERLEGVDYKYHRAAEFQYTMADEAGGSISEWLLALLILLLIGEQILAWSCSYHPPARVGLASAKGGVR
jgi:hypothetical protein